ncbi:MAG: HD domain-containing protein [Bauldia sp.]
MRAAPAISTREVCVVTDADRNSANLSRLLANQFAVRVVSPRDIGRAKPSRLAVVDIDLRDPAHHVDLRQWLNRRPDGGKAIFAVERGEHADAVRAYAIGASDLIDRPVERLALLAKLADEGKTVTVGGELADDPIGRGTAAAPAVGALRDIFSAAFSGEPIDQVKLNAAGQTVVTELGSTGIASWIDTVRKHHSQTYQHSLLVTGFAVAFGQRLGLSEADQKRLSVAGLVHDIGKARIPLAILEKPGPLDKAEVDVMKQHPIFGLAALEQMPDMPKDIINTAVHHHEYLDGSGYPYGLAANEITDLVRILTISDVFGAMMERRSYKPPMKSEDAYGILLAMGPKLDRKLVRDFMPVSKAAIAV